METWYKFIEQFEAFKKACVKVAFYLKDINPNFEVIVDWSISEDNGTKVVSGYGYDYAHETYVSAQFDIDLLGYSDYELAKYVQATLEGHLEGTI